MKRKSLKQNYRVKKLKQVDRPPYLGTTSTAQASEPSLGEPTNPPVSRALQEEVNQTVQLVPIIPSETPPIVISQMTTPISVSSTTAPVPITADSNPPVVEEINEPKSTDEREQPDRELVNLSKLEFEQLNQYVAEKRPTIQANYVYNPKKEIVLNGRVYEKDKDIHFYDILHFVPNYDILLYKEDLDKKLGELVELLKENPEKKVRIYGHGGLEYEEGTSEFEIHHQKVPPMYEYEKVYYGSNHEVYEQRIYGLGNEDPYHIHRIEEENRIKVEEAQVGSLLYARARRIKDYLIQQGISKKRISALRGSYMPHPNHLVEIKVTD